MICYVFCVIFAENNFSSIELYRVLLTTSLSQLRSSYLSILLDNAKKAYSMAGFSFTSKVDNLTSTLITLWCSKSFFDSLCFKLVFKRSISCSLTSTGEDQLVSSCNITKLVKVLMLYNLYNCYSTEMISYRASPVDAESLTNSKMKNLLMLILGASLYFYKTITSIFAITEKT